MGGLRSWLFVPGDSERKQAKALSTAADALILDLEDSVDPGQLPAARRRRGAAAVGENQSAAGPCVARGSRGTIRRAPARGNRVAQGFGSRGDRGGGRGADGTRGGTGPERRRYCLAGDRDRDPARP